MTAGQGRYAIDAGGTRTTVRVRTPHGQEHTTQGPSCAIAAVGADLAVAEVTAVLEKVRAGLGDDRPAAGCLASSSFPVAGEAPLPEVLLDAVRDAGPPGQVFLVNDVVPLLWASPVLGHGVIVNSGTGSAVLARHRDGRILKLGGHEYLLSDSGSAYAIARAGLRAALLAVDGISPPTPLVVRAETFYGRPLRVFARELAERCRVRADIARFAPEVLDAAGAGDPTASGIVTAEADALVPLVTAAADRLDLGPEPVVGMSGGVLRASASFRALVVAGLRRAGLRPRVEVLDPVASAMAFVDVAERGGDRVLGPVGGLRIGPR